MDKKEKEKEAKEKELVVVEKEPVTEPIQVDEPEEPTISKTADTYGMQEMKNKGGKFLSQCG